MIDLFRKFFSRLLIFSTLLLPLWQASIVTALDLPQQALDHMPVCTVGNPNIPRCHAQVVTDSKGKPLASTSPTGYGPAQFLGAYSLTGTAAVTRTIAIVDAYDNPNVLADLNTYSATFGISTMTACPVATGSSLAPCFQKVDQRGGTTYPSVDSGWALEIALDVESAHAICQNCNLLLVEADSNSYSNLMAAVDRAVAMGANVVSNSYGSSEFSGETTFDSHFNVLGVAITFSSGDSGFGASYPAASRYVTSVGGTTLNLNGNTYVSESAWSGSGSGCSSFETKPTWQHDTGCSRRMIADVAADADPNTGAAVYDSVPYSGQTGWFQVGGTSLAAPLIAGVYALAADTTTLVAPNSLPYTQGSYLTSLHDVTKGANGGKGQCRRYPNYFCQAGNNYDGPTGLGTPKGVTAF